jgi:hypothetical protein
MVKDEDGLYADWILFNVREEVFEQAGAQGTFALKRGGIKTNLSAEVGEAPRKNYRKTFFEGNSDLEGEDLIVHHAVEQQVLTKYPGVFNESQINSFKNLRGIPIERNNELHLSIIRKIWDTFYLDNPNSTMDQILKQATKIDGDYGHLFNPTIKLIQKELPNVSGYNFARGLILLEGLEINEATDTNCVDDCKEN